MKELISREMIRAAYETGVLTLAQGVDGIGAPSVVYQIGSIEGPIACRVDWDTGKRLDTNLDLYLRSVSVDDIVENVFTMLDEYGRGSKKSKDLEEYMECFKVLSEELQMWPDGFVEDFVKEYPGLAAAMAIELENGLGFVNDLLEDANERCGRSMQDAGKSKESFGLDRDFEV